MAVDVVVVVVVDKALLKNLTMQG